MPWGVAATVALGAYTADKQSDAAEDAANAQARGNDAAIAEQRAARQQYRTDIQPYLDLSGTALGNLQRLQSGDISAFRTDPGYQFALDQGLEAVRARGAAGGNYGGGGTTADILRFSQGLADQGYGDFWNRNYNLATLGQNAVAGVGSAGQNTASNIGNLLASTGQAQGNAAINSANAWSNFGGQLGSLAGQYAGQGGFNFGGSPGAVSVQPISMPNAGVNVSNVPVTGRIYG